VLLNGVLAGAEIAIVSLRQTRLRELVKQGGRRARAIEGLRNEPERFLATVQIGITVVGATAGAFGGATFGKDVEPWLQRIPGLAPYAPEVAIALVVGLVSYLSLVLGELVPKSLALRSPERYALLVSLPLRWLSTGTRPLAAFLTASSNVVLRLFGDTTSFTESRLSPDELRQMVEAAAKAGTVHPQAGAIAARALDFASLTAAEVMVPRSEVVSIRRDASKDELHRVLAEQNHSRFPVYEGQVDRVVGYLSTKEALVMAWEEPLLVLADFLRPAFFVPEAKPAIDLLAEMRQRHQPFAVVVDEHGGMVGIVTIEDLLEELVGEIFSEHVPPAPEPFRRDRDGSVVALGSASIRELNRELGLELPTEGDWTTVAGLCLALAGRIPEVGERLSTPCGATLEVLDASPRRVRAVRVLTGVQGSVKPTNSTPR
jgi:putative hemolysin